MSIKLVIPSNCLILCWPVLLSSIFPSIRVFSNESVLHIRCPKYWSFSFSIYPSECLMATNVKMTHPQDFHLGLSPRAVTWASCCVEGDFQEGRPIWKHLDSLGSQRQGRSCMVFSDLVLDFSESWSVTSLSFVGCKVMPDAKRGTLDLTFWKEKYQIIYDILICQILVKGFSSVTQSCLTLCDPKAQHARPPCPSPSPGVCSNSCLLSWWCHPTISSPVNLYAGQEATVRTGHGKTDWFQIGKGCMYTCG